VNRIRIRRPWLRIPPLALALSLALVAASAASAAAPVRVVGVDTGGYPELRVTVVAPPGSAQPRLREDGVPVTGLEAHNLGRAKSVVLLIDNSQSMSGKPLADAIAAARTFVGAKGPGDRIEVIGFGHQALALTRFSSSTADADAALRDLKPDKTAGTALYDAIALGSRKLAAERQPGHVIIVLTDGRDVSSNTTFGRAVNAAHRAGASIYPIGISGPDYTPEPLRDLAARTGGSYHEAASTKQLASIYGWIGRTLSHTWELRYPTAERPGDSFTVSAWIPGVGGGHAPVELAGIGPASATPPPSNVLPRSLWASPMLPLFVALLVGFLILLACGFVIAARHGLWVRARLEPHLGQPKRVRKTQRKRESRPFFQQVVAATERAFANVKQFRYLQRLIERADLPLRASELMYICIGSGLLVGLFAAAIVPSMLAALVLMGVAGSIPVLFVKFKAGMRIKAFDNQLPDLLITIAASLKAGHSFRHAIQAVVDEGAQPTAKEFTRVLSETQLGRPMDRALGDMSERVGSKNLTFVITAVTIQRQVGGSLAGLFDMVAETVRQRQQFARKVRGLTAMGRMSAYVLIGLPFFIALAVTVLNPSYMSPLFHSSTGHMLILLGFAMMGLGSTILNKMVSFKV
jgi:tight adherence protein B